MLIIHIDDSAYLPSVIPIASVCSGSHTVFHARFQPHPPNILASAPVTEVMTSYFPIDYSAEDQKQYDTGTRAFLGACQMIAGGPLSSSAGWVEEMLESEGGEMAKAYVALLGWESVEHHMAFRETQAFKELTGKMNRPKGLQKMGSVHIRVQEFK
jgi:hypothetical protein